MAVLFNDDTIGAVYDGTKHNANNTLLESSLGDLGPFIISGLALSIGTGLSVNVALGVASIGGQVNKAAAFVIGSLAPATTNHLYLNQDGTGTSNTSGTQPLKSVKLGTATTGASTVTAVGQSFADGRQQQVRTENLTHGGGAGQPKSQNLASWNATAGDGFECYGVLPSGAVPASSATLAGDTDVLFAGVAQGDIIYRGPVKWQNLAAGTAVQFLRSGGANANPSWVQPSFAASLSDVTLTAVAQGDIAYRGASVWNNLAAGTSAQFLKSGGAAANPSWVQPSLNSSLSDTTLSSVAQGDVLYRGATVWNNLAAGTSGRFLQTQGAAQNPVWALPTFASSLSDVVLTAAAQGDILYRNATQWVNLAAGSAGNTLKTGGVAANPSWAALNLAGGANFVTGVLPTANQAAQAFSGLSDVTLSGTAQGDIAYRGLTAWNNLAAGTAGNTLKSGGAGANPSWAPLNLAGGAAFVTGVVPDANLPTDIPFTDQANTFTVTQSISPAVNTDCLVLTANTGGGLNLKQSAGGTKRVLQILNNVFQFGTDSTNTGTADFWMQNVGSGNVVLQISATDLVTVGSSNASGGALLGVTGGKIGFLGTTPVVKPTLTGIKTGGTALVNLVALLAAYGLFTDLSI
jgi:propanediol dehydratase small subunit